MKGKKILGLFLALILALSMYLPITAAAEKVKTEYVDGSLVVREGPSTSTGKAGWVKNGQEITVLSRGKTWSKIKVDSTGKVGYIKTKYIVGNASSSTKVPDEYTIGRVQTKYASSTVNVRKGAGTKYGIVTALKNGAKVYILAESGNWYKVQTSSGLTGWMSKNYVTVGVSEKTNANVNLRKGAGTGYGVIKVVARGTTVTALAVDGNWTKVKAGSHTGWLYSKYVG